MGNIPVSESTHCPDCGELLIGRSGFETIVNSLVNGHCSNYKRVIEGVFR